MKSFTKILFLLFITINCFGQKEQYDFYFKFNSNQLETKDKKSLDSLIGLYQYGINKITLIGRTDSKGTEEYNYALAVKRVNTIIGCLNHSAIKNNIVEKTIYATKNPLGDNRTGDGRAKNRSVRVIISLRPDFKTDASFIYDLLKPRSSSYEISGNKNSIIRTRHGSIITIPANSFITATGQPTWGKVNVEITECFNLDEMLLGNLTTATTNAQVLETAGMLKITASQAIGDLKLRADANIKVKIPADSLSGDMQLFYGKHDSSLGTTWNQDLPDNRNLSFGVTQESLGYNFNLLYEDRLTNVQRDSLAFLIKELTSDGRTQILASLIGNLLHEREEIKLNKIISILKIQEIQYVLNRQEKGIEQDANGIYLFKGKTMRYLDLNEIHFKGVNFKEANYISYSINDKKYWEEVDTTINVFRININNYILRVSELGWINCDKFRQNSTATDVIASADDSFQPIYRIVFKDFKAMLPAYASGNEKSNTGVFKNIPVGSSTIIVAYAVKDGALYYGTKETKIESNAKERVELHKVSLEEFQKLVKELNRNSGAKV